MNNKKILFYATNGMGVGHLERIRLISEAIRDLDKSADFLFVTMSKAAELILEKSANFIKLLNLSDELLEDNARLFHTQQINRGIFSAILNSYRPDLLVADIFLIPFDFFPIFPFLRRKNKTKKVFIFRKGDSRSFSDLLEKEQKLLDCFDGIIFPHSSEEIKESLPGEIFPEIKNNPKYFISGPIYRKLDIQKINYCRKKYGISSRDFLLTITFGGGGAYRRCEIPAEITENFLKISGGLFRKIPNLKIIFITGPLFKKRIAAQSFSDKNLKIVNFEENLVELIYLSKLVISSAGYNTCNEIIEARTPAILIPMKRTDGEQIERVRQLEKYGIARSLTDYSYKAMEDLIIECKNNLKSMKKNFKYFQKRKPGNKIAAKMILNLLKC